MKVSIVVPVYNDADYVVRMLRSCQRQTHRFIEIVCVDDGSTDESLSLLNEAASADARVKVVALESNGGSHNARRAGLAAATGELVTFLDADDELNSHFCERMVTEYVRAPYDVLHFATFVKGDGHVPVERVREMTRWCTPLEGPLFGRDILVRSFVNYEYAFNVAGKAFPIELARKAFDAIGDIKADSSEDVLEYFAIGFFADSYRGLPGLRYYVYHLGDGGSALADMTTAQFARALRSSDAVAAVGAFLESQGAAESHADIYEAHRVEQLRVLLRTWDAYVRPDDKAECLSEVIGRWPEDDVVSATCELGSDAVSILKKTVGQDYPFTNAHYYAMGVADGARAEREGIHATGTYRLGNAVGALPRKVLALMGR